MMDLIIDFYFLLLNLFYIHSYKFLSISIFIYLFKLY